MEYPSAALRALLLVFVLCFAFLHNTAFAQPSGAGGMTGTVSGRVVDANSKNPIEFATITLISARDSSIATGGISDQNGRFLIDDVKMGAYQVHISFIGFEITKRGPIRLNPRDGIKVDLGEVQLLPMVNALEAAEVVEKREFMELMMDKRVFNVGENLGVTGGNATDVLETLPSIEVDADGAVSLRGSQNVTILIDGKPSSLTGASRQAILEQLPAASIDRIEVITNPSAKYDADGMTGIINIVLKKNKLSGFNGNVSISAATGDQYNGSLGLNYRTKKANVFANYAYRYSDTFSRSTTDRTTFFPGPDLVLDQDEDGFNIRQSHNVNLGTDFYLNPSNTLSVGARLNFGGSTGEELLYNDQFYDDGAPLRYYTREGFDDSQNFGYDLTAGWRADFTGRDHFLTADLQYGNALSDNNTDIINTDFDALGLPMDGLTAFERNRSEDLNETLTIQTDYSRPLHGEKGKIETGYKTIVRNIDTGFFGESLDNETNIFSPQVDRNNDFRYSEAIHAVYASYGRKIKKFSLQGGLRAEQVYTRSELLTTDERFRNDYFSLFPSAYATYAVSDKSDLSLSYSRRISRPGTRQLNPFPNYTNELNIFNGNPFLLPEYIHAMEAGYNLRRKRTTWLASVYLQDMSNVISRFNRVDTNGVNFGTWENIADVQSLGIELIANTEILPWWNINLSGNGYRKQNNGSNLEGQLRNTALSWSLRAMSSMKFKNGYNIQISGFYRAPEQFIQGDFSGFSFIDVSVKKSVFKNKGSITLNLRDAFDTREFNFDLVGPTFTQARYRKRESRNLFVTFSYNFGKLESGRDRRKGRSGGGEGGFEGGGMDME